MTAFTARGSCLCGGVRYEVRGRLRPVVACHCTQCRKTTGHFMAATAARRSEFTLVVDSGLCWYASSASARRGFCRICGATLFWDRPGRDSISIAAGTLDTPSGVSIVQHIHTADKGDYYTLADGLPCSPDGQFDPPSW